MSILRRSLRTWVWAVPALLLFCGLIWYAGEQHASNRCIEYEETLPIAERIAWQVESIAFSDDLSSCVLRSRDGEVLKVLPLSAWDNDEAALMVLGVGMLPLLAVPLHDYMMDAAARRAGHTRH